MVTAVVICSFPIKAFTFDVYDNTKILAASISLISSVADNIRNPCVWLRDTEYECVVSLKIHRAITDT